MAGKNRANTLSAILSNMEDLEGAYESAMNAEGSALRENEAYLDSIQGRIDLFTNALQTFWMNFIDSSVIKGIVDLGTALMKLLDTAHGKIIAVVGAFMLYEKIANKVKFTNMFTGTVNVFKEVYSAIKSIISGTKELTAATLSQSVASKISNKELQVEISAKIGLAAASGKTTKELIKETAAALTTAFTAGKLSAAQYLAAMSTMGLKTALQGLWAVLQKNPFILIATAIATVALALDHFTTTSQEASDAAKEAFDEMQSVVESTKSTIQSLESELSTLQDKINELDGKELSFADSEELEKLKKQREELEHSLKVQEQLSELQQNSSNKQAVASMKAYTKAASEGSEETQETAKTWGTIVGTVLGIGAVIGGTMLMLTGVGAGPGAAIASAGIGGIATGAAAGGFGGNKVGEWLGSKASENEGTYDSWYDTYTKALEASRKEEQKALEAYQKDSSNIDKLDKWQEAQQKVSDIETEMYEHLSQMQQYYNGLEYGISDEVDKELDTWYNFLDKFSIDQGASGAEVTALDRIFGENASEEIQSLKDQILDTISSGKDFDFTSAINGSKELNDTLNYMGLTVEDVKNYFTQIGESAAKAAVDSEEIISFKTYSAMTESISQYNDILEQTLEILVDNTEVTQEYKDSIIELVGSEEEVNECFDDNNSLIVKNAKQLKNLISQNVKLKKAQNQLDYYNLVKQLNSALNGTKQLDGATRDSIYTTLEQIDAVEKAIYQYQLLEDQLLGTSNAFKAFEDAKEIDSLNTYGDSYVEMVQTMYDGLYKTGQVGTEQFWTAVESLVPDSIYQSLIEDADKMQAIFEYFKKNILTSGTLDEDTFSLDYSSIEKFVNEGLFAGVFTGNVENFDLVEGMNLEKAAELMGKTETQAYALFAELDKYNISGNEPSFLSQLDNSLEGRVINITNEVEELNRQKLALLEDGGYDKNKEAIESINQQIAQCDKELESAGVEAYNMWQEYSKNDVALNALKSVENKQKEITKEGASTLGLEWDEVKGKTIQQVLDEISVKQAALGTPTELTVQLVKEQVDAELADLEKKLTDKQIDIDTVVKFDYTDQQYEVSEDSEYANDEDLQKYVELKNEGYTLDNYFESGLTATEGYLSNIESILQGIYDFQTGKNTENNESVDSTAKTDKTTDGTNIEMPDLGLEKFANSVADFFTDTIPEVASNISEDLNKFFAETLPQEWNEFWSKVGESLGSFGNEVEEFYNIVNKFFAETLPQEWNEFWSKVGESLNEIWNDAQAVYNVVSIFFKETIPQKWEEFWNSVDDFLTEDAPYAIGYAAGVVTRFFTETIPQKWDEFWDDVGESIDNIQAGVEELRNILEKFFSETIPEKWDELWENINDFYEEIIDPIAEDVKEALSTFFNETLPEKWNEFWDDVDNFFTTTIPTAVGNTKDAIYSFFTVTLPSKWNELWNNLNQFIDTSIMPALGKLQNKLITFFTVSIPQKWDEFWNEVETFFTKTIPAALGQLGEKISNFFTVTIPAKWTEFWNSIDAAFVTPISTAISTISNGITTFFTSTVPNAINEMWSSLSTWISEKASEVWSNITAGFTAGSGGGDSVNGTAHVLGTAQSSRVAHARGTANKSGSWGAPRTETSLVGELGPEILVRGNQWTTIGDNGAEFTQVRKGDIIFNHQQTEALLSKGYVTGRGKLKGGESFASGTAYAGLWKPTNPSYDSGKSSLSNAADSINDAADKFEEVFDWIEVRIEEIVEAIDLNSAKLENTIGYSKKNSIVDEMIDLNKTLYDNLIAGANEYNEYAAALLSKIPAEYREAAQNGAIAIEEFVGKTDEKTLEAIQEYREWAQKAADVTQQAEETITEISALAKQAIDNIASDYENKASIRDNEVNQLDAYNALSETKYGAESEDIYKEIIKETNKNIKTLQEQRNKMQAELNQQVESGHIKKYSQDWYDAVNDIAAVDTEIIELTADTYDYQDAINELHWDHFDNLMSQFEAIADETDNLIDILGNKDLVDPDTAEWTDEGIASLGLYAQKLEIAEIQAAKYREEIDYLNKNWEKLGYTETEYLEKLDELKDGQYSAIELYNSTRDAIVDLNEVRVDAIKDGISREIEEYEKLITIKKEELDAEKD